MSVLRRIDECEKEALKHACRIRVGECRVSSVKMIDSIDN